MIRKRVIANLRELATSLGSGTDGTVWHLFGSVERDEPTAEDIDLMILCKNDEQADELRRNIDPDALMLPLHLALMTYEEASEIDAVGLQNSHSIFP